MAKALAVTTPTAHPTSSPKLHASPIDPRQLRELPAGDQVLVAVRGGPPGGGDLRLGAAHGGEAVNGIKSVPSRR